jgi:hypothetical protein
MGTVGCTQDRRAGLASLAKACMKLEDAGFDPEGLQNPIGLSASLEPTARLQGNHAS